MRSMLWIVIAGLALSGPLTAQDKPAASAPPAGQAMQAIVVSVSGSAQKMLSSAPEPKWEPLKAGDRLDEMTVIRTGLRSKVVLNLADRGEVDVESATKVGIAELRKSGQQVSAAIGLKYGMVRATVESARGPNDVRIATPTATLAVRHSKANVAFTEVGMGLQVQQSPWRVRSNVNLVRTFYPGQVTNDRLTAWHNLAPLMRAIYLGDNRGLTRDELDFLANHGEGRGQLRFLRELEKRDDDLLSLDYLRDLPSCCSWIRDMVRRR